MKTFNQITDRAAALRLGITRRHATTTAASNTPCHIAEMRPPTAAAEISKVECRKGSIYTPPEVSSGILAIAAFKRFNSAGFISSSPSNVSRSRSRELPKNRRIT